LSDTKVYEPSIRALLETAAYFCEVVVLKLTGVAGVICTSTPPTSRLLSAKSTVRHVLKPFYGVPYEIGG